MAKRPGVYLFEAGSHEDILANDGKLAVDDFLTARRVLNSFSSLSFASDCSFFPVHYEEDLVQEERRKNFVLKDWAVAALVSDDSGKLLKALLVNLSHHDEGFLVEVDGLIKEFCGILKDDDALLHVVVDLGSVVLNLLLELVEVILGFDLHDGEDDARNDTKDPKKNLEDQRADADFDGDLLLDDINVTAFFRNRASDFV